MRELDVLNTTRTGTGTPVLLLYSFDIPVRPYTHQNTLSMRTRQEHVRDVIAPRITFKLFKHRTLSSHSEKLSGSSPSLARAAPATSKAAPPKASLPLALVTFTFPEAPRWPRLEAEPVLQLLLLVLLL